MNIRIQLLIIGLITLLSPKLLDAQEEHGNTHDHLHNHKYEIGLANSLVYFVNEQEFSYGLHLHLVRSISHTKFGIGLAYERIFDDHKHNTIGVVGTFTPVDRLHIALSPGVSFEAGDFSESRFSLHLETSYDFQVGPVHIGPLLEFAYDVEDVHISLGLHIGMGF